MKGSIPQAELNKYIGMGFQEPIIEMAWQQSENATNMLDMLFSLNETNSKLQQDSYSEQKALAQPDDDVIMNQVILDSLKESKFNSVASFETMNPEQRKRVDGVPVGLKNVGNTCYFNSLLQSYFFNNEFVKSILSYLPPPGIDLKKEENLKLKNSVQLVLNLQSLFISMIGSSKKYIDPTDVVKSISDDFGNLLPIGDQKDVGEFNHYFLSRVEEGLQTSKNFQSKSSGGSIQEEQNKSPSNMQEEYPHEHLHEPTEQSQQTENTSALLRQKSKIVSSESLVSKLFFGKARQTIEFQENNQTIVRETEELFNFIPLDVKYKSLYDAWDHWIVSDIEGFKNDGGKEVKATKYNWISTPPQSLFFQIQRTQYDKERQDVVKINDLFKFDTEIYIDRFLNENKKKYLDIREKVIQIQVQQQEFEAGMKKLESYNGFNLPQSVGQVAQFIDLQRQPAVNGIPESFGLLNFQDRDLQNAVQVLQEYKKNIQLRYDHFKQSYEKLEKKIQSSYNNLRTCKYQLQSILIHDGFANSGHYYAYIWDVSLKNWVKFNDTYITQEQEDVVLKEALGGNAISAYLLVYVRQDIAEKDSQHMIPLRSYHLDNEGNDMYHSYLTLVQKESLKYENQLYRQEIDDYKASRCVDGIIDSYQKKFEFINEHSRLLKNKFDKVPFKPPNLLNIVIYVKNHQDNLNNKYENLLKWMILDSCVRELHPNKISILQIQDGGFLEKLKNKSKSVLSDFKAPKFPLSDVDRITILCSTDQYMANVLLAAKSVYMMEAFIGKNWIPALVALNDICHSIDKQKLDTQSYFHKLIQSKQKLLPISIFLDLEENPQKYNDAEIIDILGVLINFLNQKFTTFKEFPTWRVQLTILMSDITTVYDRSAILREQLKKYSNNIDNDAIQIQYEQILQTLPQDYTTSLNVFVNEYDVHSWSIYKVDDVLFDRLQSQFDQIKNQFKNSITFLDQLKKTNFPIMASDRKKKL